MVDPASNYALYDEDLLAIMGRTIPQQFIFCLDSPCSFCSSSANEEIYKLSCDCKICATCCKDKVSLATDGKVILNNFEKSKFLIL